MPVWAAEIEIDERLVRGLLAQFALEGARLRKLAEGWDNSVWVVDERYAFRFPRRAIAIPGVEREIAVLPRLAPLLPLPVPRPVFVGGSAEDYPWPFFGCELLPGVEAGDAALDDDARLGVALDLARFLRTLHSVDLECPCRSTSTGGRTCRSGRLWLGRSWLSSSVSASGEHLRG
jgi:aminoglycoside phosphotransferase (APT) family kinase protein